MIKLVKSTFYKEEETKNKLSKFIRESNYLSLGAECLKFEKSFAKYQQRKYCVFFNSGSSANLVLLQSLYNLGKIEKGDYAGFSAISWPTNVTPLIQLKFINAIIKIRNRNFFKIAPILYATTDKYYPIKYNHIDFLSNFAIPLICKSGKIRNELIKKCKDKIEIRPVVGGDLTEQPFFIKYAPESAKLLNDSNAALIHRQGLYFGNNPELTNQEIGQIIEIFS